MKTAASKIKLFLEMIKFEHSIFALPFAYLGLILAERGRPAPHLWILVTAAMVSFRTMAMGTNRLIDHAIDAANPRTRGRALPAGRLKKNFVRLSVLAAFFIFEATAYALGPICFLLSPVPVLLACVYPFAKRFTWLSHLLLGIILGIAPYGAWLASRGTFSWIPGFLSLGMIAWVAGFDIIYALQDMDFDRANGLFSIPARFGSAFSLALTRVLHLATLIFWLAAGKLAGLGALYMLGLVAAAAFMLREHWLVRSFGLKKIQEAFFTMNAVVSLSVFLAAAADFSLRRF